MQTTRHTWNLFRKAQTGNKWGGDKLLKVETNESTKKKLQQKSDVIPEKARAEKLNLTETFKLAL